MIRCFKSLSPKEILGKRRRRRRRKRLFCFMVKTGYIYIAKGDQKLVLLKDPKKNMLHVKQNWSMSVTSLRQIMVGQVTINTVRKRIKK